MAATLNLDDIKLLKSIFATKDDLVAMEKRQDTKYATKGDLTSMEKRQDAKHTTKDDLKKMERRIIKRVDLVDKSLDRTLMDVTKDVDRIKAHFNLSFPSI